MDTDSKKPLGVMSRWVDGAYLLPMGAFLVFTWVGGHWPWLYSASYIVKTLAAAGLLIGFWRFYTRVSWRYWQLGILVGVVGVFQWVGMEKLILHFWPHYPRPSVDVLDPFKRGADGALLHYSSLGMAWAFVIFRWAGASLMVPFMEELFWRDYVWRTVLAPNDIRLAEVGEWDWRPFWFVAIAFSTVHVQWMTAIVWGLMIGWLLVRTRSLGACIIAHGVTNFLLGAYVLWTRDWYFW
jgi:hypothetical protein